MRRGDLGPLACLIFLFVSCAILCKLFDVAITFRIGIANRNSKRLFLLFIAAAAAIMLLLPF